ncbi:ankyrin repeat domain-containing protein 50-like [Cloeon dipterum]|uniref:ankyrin repeat domain-containing protein 50-like n=1 Tax=Cloeon dipterum TaxID=197152 RepID=UPI00321FDB2A
MTPVHNLKLGCLDSGSARVVPPEFSISLRGLIKAGADPNAKDADGRSTLYVLALENRVSMARCLIAESASFGPTAPPPRGGLATPTTLHDLEGADSEGRTPLHVSAWQGHTDMAALLLDAGADVNATDKKRTALQAASWQNTINSE